MKIVEAVKVALLNCNDVIKVIIIYLFIVIIVVVAAAIFL